MGILERSFMARGMVGYGSLVRVSATGFIARGMLGDETSILHHCEKEVLGSHDQGLQIDLQQSAMRKISAYK